MKKMKILVGILVLSSMFMGAAYANWTQSFTVMTTVDTGELDITVTPGKINQPKYMDTHIERDGHGNDLKVTMGQMYPGAEVTFDFTVENTGTLGVLLDYIRLRPENATDKELEEELDVAFSTNGTTFMTRKALVEKLSQRELTVNGTTKLFVRTVFDENGSLKGDDLEMESVDLILEFGYQQFNILD